MSQLTNHPDSKQFKANLPSDVLAFLSDEAKRYGSSVNSELTRAAREKMERRAALLQEEGAAR